MLTAVGADMMNGGTGNDTYDVDNAGDVANEASGEGTPTRSMPASATRFGRVRRSSILRANAGATGLTLTGNELANTIYGGAGVITSKAVWVPIR